VEEYQLNSLPTARAVSLTLTTSVKRVNGVENQREQIVYWCVIRLSFAGIREMVLINLFAVSTIASANEHTLITGGTSDERN